MDSLLVALLVAAVVWLLGRVARGRAAKLRAAPQPAMPRIGEPGTIMDEQFERLEALGFEASRHWSREEAGLILDAVAYLRAVIAAVRGPGEAPLELQNTLLASILSDPELRQRARGWSSQPSAVVRDAQFDRVAARIDRAG